MSALEQQGVIRAHGVVLEREGWVRSVDAAALRETWTLVVGVFVATVWVSHAFDGGRYEPRFSCNVKESDSDRGGGAASSLLDAAADALRNVDYLRAAPRREAATKAALTRWLKKATPSTDATVPF